MPASHCAVRHSPEPCAIHVPRRPPARSHPPGKEKCFGVTAEGSASAQCACISGSCLLGEGSGSDRLYAPPAHAGQQQPLPRPPQRFPRLRETSEAEVARARDPEPPAARARSPERRQYMCWRSPERRQHQCFGRAAEEANNLDANRKRLQRSSQPALCSPDVSRGGCPARDTNLWAPHLRASTQHSQTATNSKNSSSYWRPRLAVRRVLGWGLVHQLPAGARACGRGQRRSAASAVLYAIERSRTPRR